MGSREAFERAAQTASTRRWNLINQIHTLLQSHAVRTETISLDWAIALAPPLMKLSKFGFSMKEWVKTHIQAPLARGKQAEEYLTPLTKHYQAPSEPIPYPLP